MPTKRKSPAQSPAEELKPAPAPPIREDLSSTHEMIIDAVSEMLTHGGHSDQINLLLMAAMGWRRRRTYTGLNAEPEQINEYVREFIRENLIDWKGDLLIGWRKNRRPEQPAFDAKTVAERIRATVREALRNSFDDFLRSGSPEEMRLLLDTFQDWDSRHLAPESASSEVYLGMAFEYQLGRPRCYVRVPESMLDQVEKYIDALRAIEDKAVA